MRTAAAQTLYQLGENLIWADKLSTARQTFGQSLQLGRGTRVEASVQEAMARIRKAQQPVGGGSSSSGSGSRWVWVVALMLFSAVGRLATPVSRSSSPSNSSSPPPSSVQRYAPSGPARFPSGSPATPPAPPPA